MQQRYQVIEWMRTDTTHKVYDDIVVTQTEASCKKWMTY